MYLQFSVKVTIIYLRITNLTKQSQSLITDSFLNKNYEKLSALFQLKLLLIVSVVQLFSYNLV